MAAGTCVELFDGRTDIPVATLDDFEPRTARRGRVILFLVHEVLELVHRPVRVAERATVAGADRRRSDIRDDEHSPIGAHPAQVSVARGEITRVTDHEPAPDDVEYLSR